MRQTVEPLVTRQPAPTSFDEVDALELAAWKAVEEKARTLPTPVDPTDAFEVVICEYREQWLPLLGLAKSPMPRRAAPVDEDAETSARAAAHPELALDEDPPTPEGDAALAECNRQWAEHYADQGAGLYPDGVPTLRERRTLAQLVRKSSSHEVTWRHRWEYLHDDHVGADAQPQPHPIGLFVEAYWWESKRKKYLQWLRATGLTRDQLSAHVDDEPPRAFNEMSPLERRNLEALRAFNAVSPRTRQNLADSAEAERLILERAAQRRAGGGHGRTFDAEFAAMSSLERGNLGAARAFIEKGRRHEQLTAEAAAAVATLSPEGRAALRAVAEDALRAALQTYPSVHLVADEYARRVDAGLVPALLTMARGRSMAETAAAFDDEVRHRPPPRAIVDETPPVPTDTAAYMAVLRAQIGGAREPTCSHVGVEEVIEE